MSAPAGHQYRLLPTPKEHFLWARKAYHEIRADLHEAMKLKVPEPIDWVDYSANEPPILNQGDIGRCQSHQLRNVLLMGHSMVTGAPAPFDLSPEFAYWAVRQLNNETQVDSGETIGNTLAAFEQVGCAEMNQMPEDGFYTEPPTPAAYANALTHCYDLAAVPVDYSSWSNVCDVLQDRRPVIGGFFVPPSFETCGPDGVLPDPKGESSLGGHAFSVCQIKRQDAWMDDPNSWGVGYGKQGHAFMPASYLGRIMELWAIVPKSLIQSATTSP